MKVIKRGHVWKIRWVTVAGLQTDTYETTRKILTKLRIFLQLLQLEFIRHSLNNTKLSISNTNIFSLFISPYNSDAT